MKNYIIKSEQFVDSKKQMFEEEYISCYSECKGLLSLAALGSYHSYTNRCDIVYGFRDKLNVYSLELMHKLCTEHEGVIGRKELLLVFMPLVDMLNANRAKINAKCRPLRSNRKLAARELRGLDYSLDEACCIDGKVYRYCSTCPYDVEDTKCHPPKSTKIVRVVAEYKDVLYSNTIEKFIKKEGITLEEFLFDDSYAMVLHVEDEFEQLKKSHLLITDTIVFEDEDNSPYIE